MGLKNAGATCYMNSVLQQLYMQPALREVWKIMFALNLQNGKSFSILNINSTAAATAVVVACSRRSDSKTQAKN